MTAQTILDVTDPIFSGPPTILAETKKRRSASETIGAVAPTIVSLASTFVTSA